MMGDPVFPTADITVEDTGHTNTVVTVVLRTADNTAIITYIATTKIILIADAMTKDITLKVTVDPDTKAIAATIKLFKLLANLSTLLFIVLFTVHLSVLSCLQRQKILSKNVHFSH